MNAVLRAHTSESEIADKLASKLDDVTKSSADASVKDKKVAGYVLSITNSPLAPSAKRDLLQVVDGYQPVSDLQGAITQEEDASIKQIENGAERMMMPSAALTGDAEAEEPNVTGLE